MTTMMKEEEKGSLTTSTTMCDASSSMCDLSSTICDLSSLCHLFCSAAEEEHEEDVEDHEADYPMVRNSIPMTSNERNKFGSDFTTPTPKKSMTSNNNNKKKRNQYRSTFEKKRKNERGAEAASPLLIKRDVLVSSETMELCSPKKKKKLNRVVWRRKAFGMPVMMNTPWKKSKEKKKKKKKKKKKFLVLSDDASDTATVPSPVSSPTKSPIEDKKASKHHHQQQHQQQANLDYKELHNNFISSILQENEAVRPSPPTSTRSKKVTSNKIPSSSDSFIIDSNNNVSSMEVKLQDQHHDDHNDSKLPSLSSSLSSNPKMKSTMKRIRSVMTRKHQKQVDPQEEHIHTHHQNKRPASIPSSTPSSSSSSSLLRSNQAHARPEDFLSPDIRLYKDRTSQKGSSYGSRYRSNSNGDCYTFNMAQDSDNMTMVRGKTAALEKLREKTRLLQPTPSANNPNDNDQREDFQMARSSSKTTPTVAHDSSKIKVIESRRLERYHQQKNNAGSNNNFNEDQAQQQQQPYAVETRSLLKIKLGFFQISYGILLRWNYAGNIDTIVLKKMASASFLKAPPSPLLSFASIREKSSRKPSMKHLRSTTGEHFNRVVVTCAASNNDDECNNGFQDSRCSNTTLSTSENNRSPTMTTLSSVLDMVFSWCEGGSTSFRRKRNR